MNGTAHPAGEPAPFQKIRFNTKYPTITLDGLQKVELIEGSGDGDIFFLTYTADGKTCERFTNVAGLRPAERTAVLAFIGRHARTQAIRKKGKRRKAQGGNSRRLAKDTTAGSIPAADLIDLDSLIIEIPAPAETSTN